MFRLFDVFFSGACLPARLPVSPLVGYFCPVTFFRRLALCLCSSRSRCIMSAISKCATLRSRNSPSLTTHSGERDIGRGREYGENERGAALRLKPLPLLSNKSVGKCGARYFCAISRASALPGTYVGCNSPPVTQPLAPAEGCGLWDHRMRKYHVAVSHSCLTVLRRFAADGHCGTLLTALL